MRKGSIFPDGFDLRQSTLSKGRTAAIGPLVTELDAGFRGTDWQFTAVFGPEEAYERVGDVKQTVFRSGQTFDADGDAIYLCYGIADSCMALTTGREEMLR